MKPGRLNEATAVIWASVALIHGGITIGNNNEAVRAETTANIYEQQGDYAQAEQWEAKADDERDDRNIYGGLTIFNLGLAGLCGALAVSKRRESEQA